MFANIVLEFFLKGGPVMWPILISALIAVAVVGERAFWWWRESCKRDPRKLEQLLAALENSDVAAATQIAAGSEDPVIRVIRHGLNHVGHGHGSLLGALQLAAGVELKRAGRFLTVMDTLVTLAPLLGLLGTVTGLMRSFLSIGSAELSVTAVTGGIQLFLGQGGSVAVRSRNRGHECRGDGWGRQSRRDHSVEPAERAQPGHEPLMGNEDLLAHSKTPHAHRHHSPD